MAAYEELFGPAVKIPEEELDAVWVRFVELRDADKAHRVLADEEERERNALRDRLFSHYQDLVYQTADRMSHKFPRHLDVMDMINYGLLGLNSALERFDLSLAYRFTTFAGFRVRGAIFDEMRRMDPVPRSIRQQAGRLDGVYEELKASLGRVPYDEEVADRMGVSVEEAQAMARDARVPLMLSMDSKWNEDEGHDLNPTEMMPDHRAVNPLTAAMREEIKEDVLRGLKEDEKKVLMLYYYEELNMKEIGAIIGKSESRVCQIHSRTLEFLRTRYDQLARR